MDLGVFILAMVGLIAALVGVALLAVQFTRIREDLARCQARVQLQGESFARAQRRLDQIFDRRGKP